MVSKDYTDYGENIFLVGTPAIVKAKNVRVLFDLKKEEEIQAYFDSNKDAEYYFL